MVSKIIIKGLNLLDACLDEKGEIIPGKTTLVIADDDIQKLKFILAIINSSLPIFYFKEKYPSSSYNQTFTKDMINNFPIPKLSSEEQANFVEVIDNILKTAANRDYYMNVDKQKEVERYRKQIDQMVYKLYGLTEEEIVTVEKRTSVRLATAPSLESIQSTELTEEFIVS